MAEIVFPTPTCVQTCDCNESLINTGVGCATTKAVEKKTWIMNETDSAGVKNHIPLNFAITDAVISALINETDPLDRLYPLPEIKNVVDVRDKPVMYTWKDGTEVFIRDGVRKFEGMFPPDSASPQLLAILEGQRCAQPCKFAIDANGTIWGKISADGTKLYPVKMDAQSVAPIYINPTDTEPAMLAYSFNLHPSEKDCQLRGIPMSQLSGDINPLDYEGLMDVYAKVISCSVSALVVKLYSKWGTSISPEVIENLLAADFALYNVTNSSAIGFTGVGGSFSEVTGLYTFDYDTADVPTVANVLRLTPTKLGYGFTAVVATSMVVA